MKRFALIYVLGLLLLSVGAAAQTGPGDPTIVASFFPNDLQQQINDDQDPIGYGEFSCSAQYDSQTIIAGYSNGVASNISVLQQQGGTYARIVSITANLNPGRCAVTLIDVNGDGIQDVKVSFIGNAGETQDWLFTWDGTNLNNIGPTISTATYSTSVAVNSMFVDVRHDGTLQLLVPGDRTGDTPEPDILYRLVNSLYVPSPTLIAFHSVISSALPQPLSINLPIVLPTGMHGPYTLTIVNGNTQGGSRLQGTVAINNIPAISIDTSMSVASSPIVLENTNTIQISTNGAAGSQAVVLVEEIAPTSVSLAGSQTSVSMPETVGIGGDVSYSVSGLPTGVTAQFSPPTVSGFRDTVLTFLAGANTVAGPASLVITATNLATGQTQTTQLTLEVAGPPPAAGFTLSASATAVSINAGGSNAVTLTQTAPPTFADTVAYSVVGLPTGLSVAFNPTSQAGSGTSIATLVASPDVTPGTYSTSIIGTDQQSGTSQVMPLVVAIAQNSLPSGWNDQDIGSVGTGGSASVNEGIFSIQGAGCGETNSCDQANFAYQTVQANWSSVVRIAAGPGAVGMMGLMVRDNLAPGSNEVVLEIVGGTGLVLASRNATAWSASNPIAVSLPVLLRLSRLGNSFTAFYSLDGASWNQIGSSVSVPINNTTAYAGVFVSSGNTGSLLSGSFDSVSRTSWALPAGWADLDIGPVGIGGSAISNPGLFTVQGSGCGVGSACEQFHYAYTTIQGDWSIIAWLSGTSGLNTNAAAGLIIRDSLDIAANEAALLLIGGNTLTFSSRANSLWTPNASISGVSTPVWLRLTRSGSAFSAYYSTDGMTWHQVGATLSVPLNGQPTYAGLAVSSGDNGSLAASVFSNILLTPFVLAAPSSVSVAADNPATVIITEAADGAFTDPVAYSLVDPPAGLSGSFTPASLSGAGSTTLSLLVSPIVQAGFYPIKISGTDSRTGVTQFAALNLNVQSLSIPASAPVLTVPIGNTGSVTVNQTLPAGVTNGITFTVDGLVAGITAVLTPASLSTSGNVTLSVTVTNAASAGAYPLILRGTDNSTGNLVLNTIVVLFVPPTLGDFPETVNSTEQIPVTDGSGGPTASMATINSASGSMLSSVSPTNVYNAWNWNPYGLVPGTPQNYTAYSSYDPIFYSRPGAGTSQAWQELNWVLNNKYGANWNLYPTVKDIQTVIYDLLVPGYDTVDLTADGTQLLSDAQNYGSYFIPGPGQTIAIVLYFSGINATAPSTAADLLIEYTVPDMQLAFSTQPGNATAGSPMNPVVVQVEDTNGNLVNESNASVTVTSNPAGISASAAAVNGVATFSNLVLNAAGSYTLTASSVGMASATSNSFTVNAEAPAQLRFAVQPPNATAGSAMTAVVVQVQDANGNLVGGSNASITLTSNPVGISTSVAAVNGIATFSNLVLNTTGSYTLTATTSGLSSATSSSFSVDAGAAAQLKFTTQPANSVAGSTMTVVVVQVQDANGNPVTGSAASITLASNPAGVSTSTTAVNGVATFSGLVVNTAGNYTLIASGSGLTTATSNSFSIAAAGVASAAFVASDTGTQGNWVGAYGADGYTIANGSSSLPTYATLSFSGGSFYTWAASSTEARALLQTPTANDRIASTYFAATSFTIDLNLTDGQPHQVALYFLDFDDVRAETISILDASNNAVLDSRSLSNFHDGRYLVWNLSGHVLIRVTHTGGLNAVISGLFFTPAPSGSSATAVFTGTDTATQGNWVGTYGADGYTIANGDTSLPGYATVNPGGASAYTWTSSTAETRALWKNPSMNDRIVSAYYSATTFTIDVNLTDNQPHQVGLYALAYDADRSETISILDANTNALLDNRVLASFENGQYLTWNIKGHVLIRVTRTGGLNAVVSGLFFGPVPSGLPSPPTVAITNPTTGQTVSGTVTVTANASSSGGSIASVQFRLDGANLGPPVTSGSSGTYSYQWATGTASNGSHELTAIATDNASQTTTSAGVTLTVANATNSASFVAADTATLGNWKGTYGADGEIIANDSNVQPAYGSASFTQGTAFTWVASLTDDARPLLKAASQTDHIASTYYDASAVTLDVHFTDASTHRVALYLLDFDTSGRAETVTVLDADTNAVLDTRSASSFVNGEYLVWNVGGHVTLRLTPTAGPNAVVSGVFFAPVP